MAALAALSGLSGLSDGNGRGVSRCLGSANKDEEDNAGGGGLAAAGCFLGDCQRDRGVGGGVRRGDRRNANVFGEDIVEGNSIPNGGS